MNSFVFLQMTLSACTEPAGPTVNCTPHSLAELHRVQEFIFFLSQFVSLVCLCFLNLLPTEVAFWVRIPVKTPGISPTEGKAPLRLCRGRSLPASSSAPMEKPRRAGSERNASKTAAGKSRGAISSRGRCVLCISKHGAKTPVCKPGLRPSSLTSTLRTSHIPQRTFGKPCEGLILSDTCWSSNTGLFCPVFPRHALIWHLSGPWS